MKRLDAKTKKQINKVICNLGNFHDAIPLQTILNELEKHGLVILQEDNTVWSGMLCGNQAQVYFTLAHIYSAKTIVNNCVVYEPIVNASLALSWYKMSSGRYEIVTYIG